MFRTLQRLPSCVVAAAELANKLVRNVACSHFCTASTAQEQHQTRLYGQPTAQTHPHLMQKGEVSPGITLEEYHGRRWRLVQAIKQYAQHITLQTKRHLVVIPSASKVFMSERIPYSFRQNSDFFYLTGFLEPDSVLLLQSETQHSSEARFKSILFVPRRDPQSEVWDGPRTDCEGVIDLLGVDEAYDVHELPDYLCSYLRSEAGSVALWCDMHNAPQKYAQQAVKAAVTETAPKFVNSPKSLIHHLRLIKSPAEVALMSQSCQIAAAAIVETIAATDQHSTEYQLHAKVDYECRIRGAERLAYPPVVASGPRASIIHYVANTQALCHSDMVLMDAGCEYHGYVSDLTRTWPIAGTFSASQRELYEAVLEVQLELMKKCAERQSLDLLYNNMIDLLDKNLQHVGVFKRLLSKTERLQVVHKYCPHHVGHYLGLDVHDTPLVPRSWTLQPGMVITIEPGVYINENDEDAPREFRGLGIRIEDNVLITNDGIKILSQACPKTVAEIESIRQKQL